VHNLFVMNWQDEAGGRTGAGSILSKLTNRFGCKWFIIMSFKCAQFVCDELARRGRGEDRSRIHPFQIDQSVLSL